MKQQKRKSIREIKKNFIKHNTEHNLNFLKEEGYMLFHKVFNKHTKLLCHCFFIHPESRDLYYLFHINAPSYGLVCNHVYHMDSYHSHIVESYKKILRAINRKKVIRNLLNNQISILKIIE